jgi:REP element-mobilizing transposase RayT
MELFEGVRRIYSMARKPRIHFEGALYHIYSRGNSGKDVFIDNEDKRFILALVLDMKRHRELICHAYCVMTNHIHLLIQVGKYSASRVMQHILSRYAQRFNLKYNTFGHVFQGRPGMLLCQNDSYLLELLRYIHLNPVEAGLVDSPEAWPWSSHRCFAFGLEDPIVDRAWALSLFNTNVAAAEAEYRSFVAAGNTPGFAPILVPSQRPAEPPCQVGNLQELAERIIAPSPISMEQLRGSAQVRSITRVRHDLIAHAWRAGFTSTEISRFLGCSTAGVAQVLKRKSVNTVDLLESDPIG